MEGEGEESFRVVVRVILEREEFDETVLGEFAAAVGEICYGAGEDLGGDA